MSAELIGERHDPNSATSIRSTRTMVPAPPRTVWPRRVRSRRSTEGGRRRVLPPIPLKPGAREGEGLEGLAWLGHEPGTKVPPVLRLTAAFTRVVAYGLAGVTLAGEGRQG